MATLRHRVARRRRLAGLLWVALAIALPAGAVAAPGDLDPSFGSGGLVSLGPSGTEARAVAVEPDGKIVVALSTGEIARFGADGSPDAGFGLGGTAAGPFPAFDLAVQPDGRIVIAGTVGQGELTDLAVARLDVDGTVETGFGTGGIASADPAGGSDVPTAVLLQPDGGIVVAGFSEIGAHVVRFLPDGGFDRTFEADARLAQLTAATLQPDGKVVTAGWGVIAGSVASAVARYNLDGTRDAGFGDVGAVFEDLRPGLFSEQMTTCVVQPDGKIVAVSEPTADFSSAFLRLNPDGSRDPGFGVGGLVVLDLGIPYHGRSLAVQADGKLISGGSSVLRFNTEGTLDTGFGVGGEAIAGSAPLTEVAIQPDGRIVAAGGALARFLGGAPTPPAGSGSAQSLVTADVAPTLSIAVTSVVAFGPVGVGATVAGTPTPASVSVIATGGGYALSTTRSTFSNGDVPLGVSVSAPAGAVANVVGVQPIPTIGGLLVGTRATATPAAGDEWSPRYTLGPMPFHLSGPTSATVTYTVVAQ